MLYVPDCPGNSISLGWTHGSANKRVGRISLLCDCSFYIWEGLFLSPAFCLSVVNLEHSRPLNYRKSPCGRRHVTSPCRFCYGLPVLQNKSKVSRNNLCLWTCYLHRGAVRSPQPFRWNLQCALVGWVLCGVLPPTPTQTLKPPRSQLKRAVKCNFPLLLSSGSFGSFCWMWPFAWQPGQHWGLWWARVWPSAGGGGWFVCFFKYAVPFFYVWWSLSSWREHISLPS